MKWIAPITFVLIAVAACITVIFVKALKPTSGGAFLFFAAWLVLPYAIMSAVLALLRRKGAASALLLPVASWLSQKTRA